MNLPAVKLDSGLLARRLRPLIKGDVLSDRVTRLLYSTDGSIYKLTPALVVCPIDEEDVIRLILFAQENQIPLAARGAGTGLAGESLTSGILVDFTRHMTRILNIDFDRGLTRVQPGAILDEINRLARPAGWQFGPDPSSGSRATVGGSVANNATGAHSLHFGYCSDNIEALRFVLPDTRVLQTGDPDGKKLERAVFDLLNPHRKTIDQFWPRVLRNRAGYNLKGCLSRPGGNLVKLLTGSEGTLAVFTEIVLRLVRVPPVKVALSANFDDLALSARAVNLILQDDPAAIELMDGRLIALARSADANLAAVLPASQASLLIEFTDRDRLETCRARLESEFHGHVELLNLADPVEQKRHWTARKNAVPILFRQPGQARPLAVVEDMAVDAEKLPPYLDGIQTIFARYGLSAAFYGHAGAGEFHIRPFLNLRDGLDRHKIGLLTKDVYELVWSLGGTISGEHASGLVRSWALRKQYGPAYECMEQIKNRFDPDGILNPGKVIVSDTDLPLDNLRADETLQSDRIGPRLRHDHQSIAELADVCNGCGECKALTPDQRMCPVFRANRDEYSSPRAKANLFREFLAGHLTEHDLTRPAAQRVIDDCLLCENCLRECPSAVHIPQMVLELRAARKTLGFRRPIERFFTDSEYAEWLSSKFAPLTNFLFARTGVRRLMRTALGLDPARTMPEFNFPGLLNPLRKFARQHRPAAPRVRAAWFIDLYARYHDGELARDIVRVCAANGIELVIPDQCGCNMPALAYGHLDAARAAARFNLDELFACLDDVELILCFEPTATLCLKSEYKLLLDDPRLDLVAEKVRDGCEYLYQLHRDGSFKSGSRPQPLRVGYHTPCHLRQLQIGQPGYELLKLIDGLTVEPLANTCCGLAGTFGMSQEKSPTAARIAQPLAESIAQGDYQTLASECSSCRMQLKHLAPRLPALHPVRILARWYEGTP